MTDNKKSTYKTNDKNEFKKQNDYKRKTIDDIRKASNTIDGKSKNIENTNEKNNITDDDTKIESTDKNKVEEIEDVNEDSDVDDVLDEVILKLAGILNIAPEEIKNTLENLDLTLEDLKIDENLIEFVKVSYNLEDNVELLDIPNIKDIISSVKEAIDKIPESNTENSFTETLMGENADLDINSQSKVIDELIIDDESSNTSKNTLEVINQSATSETAIETVVTQNQSGNSSDQSNLFGNSQGNSEIFFDDENINPVFSQNNFVEFENILINKTMLSTSQKMVNNEDIIAQIISKMKVTFGGETESVRITLHPETLGDVTLKISTQNGIVQASFIAENEKVKQIIEAGFTNLKDELQQQGVNISSLSVSVGDNGNDNSSGLSHNNEKSRGRINEILSKNNLPIDDIYDIENTKKLLEYDLEANDSSVNYKA